MSHYLQHLTEFILAQKKKTNSQRLKYFLEEYQDQILFKI
jgi:hypothetical protein